MQRRPYSSTDFPYYEIPGTGLSTCDTMLAEAHERRGHKVRLRRVPVSTLAIILDESHASAVDLLKVNVEGMKEKILIGNDLGTFPP